MGVILSMMMVYGILRCGRRMLPGGVKRGRFAERGQYPGRPDSLYHSAYVHRSVHPSHIMLICTLMMIPVLLTGLMPAEAQDAVAYVESTDENYTSLRAAIEAANAAGDTVRLLAEVNSTTEGTTDALVISGKTMTLDLNGHLIDLDEIEDRTLVIDSGSNVTLTDSRPLELYNVGGEDIEGGVIAYGNEVKVQGSSIFTMEKGTITNLQSHGVYVEDGTFNMTGGTISNNEVHESGGGVYLLDGTFTMSGGKINGNKAELEGGGVYVFTGSFTMTNGEITGNSAKYDGGGVYVYTGSFTMTNGEITGNSANSSDDGCNGGGVYAYGGNINIGGSPVITDNNSNGDKSNVYLKRDGSSNSYINVTDNLTSSASVGVTLGTADGMGVFTNTDSASIAYNDLARFFSDETGLLVGKDTAGQLILGESVTLTYKPNGGTGEDITKTYAEGSTVTVSENTFDGPDGRPFVSWNTKEDGSGDPYIPHDTTSGSITINTDTTLYAQWAVASVTNTAGTRYYLTLQSALNDGEHGTVRLLTDIDTKAEAGRWPLDTKLIISITTLDLNGKTISAAVNGAVIYVNGITLTLIDTSPDKTGKIINTRSDPNSCGVVILGNEFKMKGGTIESTAGKASGTIGVELIRGFFDMDGGTITGWDRGVVLISELVQLDDPSFMDLDGTISGNRLGVYAEFDPGDSNKQLEVNMVGGTITGNISDDENSGYGGGVWIGGSTVFNMLGGTISDNTWAKGSGAGVGVRGGTFNFFGGTITENTAAKGGGIYVGKGSEGANSKLNLYGKPDISGNSGGNVYLDPDNNNDLYTITIVDGLNPVNPIGITLGTEDGTGVFTDSDDVTNNNKEVFFSETEDLFVGNNTAGQLLLGKEVTLTYNANTGTGSETKETSVISGSAVTVLTAEEAGFENDDDLPFVSWNTAADGSGYDPADPDKNTVSIPEDPTQILTLYAQWAAASVTAGETTTYYETLQAALNAAADGNTVTVLRDIDLDTELFTGEGKAYTLDLNGHILRQTAESRVMTVDGTLTLTDSRPEAEHEGSTLPKGGVITGGYVSGTSGIGGGVYVAADSFFSMTGGSISGNRARARGGGVFVAANGTFTMNGGSIAGNSTSGSGGGVYVAANGTFTMNGGSIADNSIYGSGNGGGVYVAADSFFSMTGGSISGNTADTKIGGGVYVESGTISLSGSPVITGNRDSSGNSNLFLKSNSCLIKVSGALTDDASVGVRLNNTTGGVITGSDDTTFNDASRFFSDIRNLAVFLNNDNQLYLAPGFTVTYDANGGTGSAADSYMSGTAVIIRNDEGFTGPAGALFGSWNTDADGTGVRYAPGGEPDPAITGNTTLYAQWKEVPYQDADDQLQYAEAYTLLTGTETSLADGWYVVSEDIEFSGSLTLSGTVNLILADGKSMTVPNGISGSGTLNIYGQSGQSGTLTGGPINLYWDYSDLHIYGGIVNVSGEDYDVLSAGNVEIVRGTVDVQANGDFGYAIFSSNVTISGGTVSATASGEEGYAIYSSGVITISGGEVNAEATGETGEAIYSSGVITISGGEVNAEATEEEGIAIYGESDLIIKDCKVTAEAAETAINIYNGKITISSGIVTAKGNWTLFAGDSDITISDADGVTQLTSKASGEGGIYSGAVVTLGLSRAESFITSSGYDADKIQTENGFAVFDENGERTGVIPASDELSQEQVTDISGKTLRMGDARAVRFDSDGGSAVETQYVANGGKAAEPDPAPEKDGYVFRYWYAADPEQSFDFENTQITEDITLTARWGEVAAQVSHGEENPVLYSSLKQALEAAADGDTVTVLKAVDEPDADVTLLADAAITLNTGEYSTVLKSLTVAGTGKLTVLGDAGSTVMIADAKIAGVDSTVFYGQLADAMTAAVNDDTVTVLRDIDLTAGLFTGEGKAYTLDLNGKTVSAASYNAVIKISNNTSLTLTDGSTDKSGKVINAGSNGNARGVVVDGGTFTVNGGTIESTAGKAGLTQGVELIAGTFIMDGGKITGWGTGVIFDDLSASENAAAVFNMGGGSIEGNNIGVFVQSLRRILNHTADTAFFNMTGGTITDNISDEDPENNGYGGGVWIDGGAEFNMSGGTISGNTWAEGSGAGIGVYGGTFNLSGGTISGNTAAKGGGIYVGMSYMGTGSEFNLQGSPDISGNNGGNVYLDLDNNDNLYTIKITGGLDPANPIGITLGTEDGTGVFTDSDDVTNNNKEVFFSETENLFVGKNTAGQLLIGKEVTLTYHANTGTGSATKETNVISGSAVTVLTAEEAGFENDDDLPFVSWNTAADGSGILFHPAVRAGQGGRRHGHPAHGYRHRCKGGQLAADSRFRQDRHP